MGAKMKARRGKNVVYALEPPSQRVKESGGGGGDCVSFAFRDILIR